MTAYDDDADRLGDDCEWCGEPNFRCRCNEVCPVCGKLIFAPHFDGFEYCECAVELQD